jgi:hypothetical protein
MADGMDDECLLGMTSSSQDGSSDGGKIADATERDPAPVLHIN